MKSIKTKKKSNLKAVSHLLDELDYLNAEIKSISKLGETIFNDESDDLLKLSFTMPAIKKEREEEVDNTTPISPSDVMGMLNKLSKEVGSRTSTYGLCESTALKIIPILMNARKARRKVVRAALRLEGIIL